MDPKLVYWTAALVNMSLVVSLAVAGVRMRRRNEIGLHRRLMLTGGVLVVLFLLSYAGKLLFLGREDMASWSSGAVWVLRIHEAFVLTMLIAGIVATRRGLAIAATRNVTGDPSDPPAAPERARGHRVVGWIAVCAAVAGFSTAVLVLWGMYQRAGVV
ncbi:MAG: DUF420 domain-containing protein [Myxococcota bacterium]|nr:DUF420 domain-containing protein [Myxococcota bacterium]